MDHLHHENRAKTSCSAPTNSRYKINKLKKTHGLHSLTLQVTVAAPVALHLGGAEAGQCDVWGPGLRPHYRPQRLAQEEAAPEAPAPRSAPRH